MGTLRLGPGSTQSQSSLTKSSGDLHLSMVKFEKHCIQSMKEKDFNHSFPIFFSELAVYNSLMPALIYVQIPYFAKALLMFFVQDESARCPLHNHDVRVGGLQQSSHPRDHTWISS